MTAEEQGATPEEAPKTTTSLWDTLSAAEPVEMPEDEAQQYEDAAVNEAEADMGDVPPWLATRWRDLPEESMGEIWAWLRGWVDWLVVAHRIPQDEIPACWFRHQDIVEELWAAAGAEAQAWEATTPTMMPMTAWHFHLRMMRDRLKGRAKECVANKGHVPARSYVPGWGPGTLPVDEADWAAHLAEVRDLQPVDAEPEDGIAMWRMCATDESGTVVHSDAVEVGTAARLSPVRILDAARLGTTSEGSILLGATVEAGGGSIGSTWWESSVDGGSTWETAPGSEVRRGPDESGTDDDDDDER